MTAVRRDRELHHFLLLDHEEQVAAIQRLARSGMGDYTIAAATGLSVEAIRRIIGERKPSCEGCE